MHNKEAIEMMRRSAEDIKQLRRRIDELAPKAEAFEMLKKVLLVLLPSDRMGMGEDVVWQLENRIRELEKEEAEANKVAPAKPKLPTEAELQAAFEDMIRSREARRTAAEKAGIIAKAQGDELVDERMIHGSTSEAMRKIGYNEDGV